MAVFCWLGVSVPSVSAQTFKHDFLYKFMSRWTDVTTDGLFFYVTNSSYSQVQKYSVGGVFNSLWGGAGAGSGQLKQPMGLVYVGGHVYVADTGNSRIEEFDDVGGYLNSFGTYGSGSNQFDHPQGVAVDSTEAYAFVADTGNNRIQAIPLGGGTFYSQGSLGTGNTQFSAPKGIAVYGSAPTLNVFVADSGNNRVVVYQFDTVNHIFTYQGQFGSFGTTSDVNNIRFNQPNKITIDTSGSNYVYVTDSTNRVQKFTNGRSFVSQWYVHSSQGTTGITTYTSGSTTAYTVEPYNQIDSYNAQTGIYSSSFTDEANQPVDVALDISGNIYINNNLTNTVTKFSSSWAPVVEWGGNVSPFNNALGIGVNTGGEVCVADSGNNRVQRFTTNGVFMAELPTPMATPTGFNGPRDVANEATGKMYIADTFNNRILKYKSDNTPDWSLGNPTPTWSIIPGPLTPTPVAPTGPFFYHPYGITVDLVNKIYIADSGFNRIQKFDANGNIEKSWGEYGSADSRPEPQFDNPQGMAIGPEPTGYIYVADTGNNRIQRFDQQGTLGTRVLWGQYGTGDGQFNQPRNVAVDTSSRVYVSEVANKRIQVFGDGTLNAGLGIVETGGTAVTEDGSVYDSYTVQLLTQPSANVDVTVASSDSAQLTVSSPTLTFTPYNWNVPQTVTVLPIHDFIDQPATQHITITHVASSSDPHYQSNGLSLSNVDVTLTDTDTAGVTFSTFGVAVAELGNGGPLTASYSAVLNSKPASALNNVTITATSTGGYTTISPASCIFTQSNWDTPCYFNVSAVHDGVANGPTHHDYISNTITTADPGYTGMSLGQVDATVTDNVDHAGITMSTDTLTVDEGSSTTYTLVLNSKPTADVTISIATPGGSMAVGISPASVTFTPANYNTIQTITITGTHDFIVNATNPHDETITNTSSSADPMYQQGTIQYYVGLVMSGNTVLTHIVDHDVAGVNFASADGLNYVTEGQTTHTYSMVLTSQPSGGVVFVSTSDTEATTSAYVHIFTPANWNVPQITTISAPNDNIYQGTHSATLTHTIVASGDPNYPVSSGGTYSFNIIDTDYPGIVFNLPNGSVNIQEGGAGDQYYMHLKTRPLADVTINVNGGSDATVAPSSLTFTTANWNVDQIATVSAINNFIVQGAHTGTLVHTASSTDAGYNGLTSSLIINIADDDNTVPGVQIVQPGQGVIVAEAGPEVTYTMALTSRPTANVRIRILGNNWQATTSAAIFTFTPTLWNIPQTVHVHAIDDPQIDGTQTTIFHSIVTSLDTHYNDLAVDDVIVTSLDNDGVSASTAKPPTCGQTPPADVPNLFQIDAGANSATLYFTPIKDNVDYYFIAYGYTPGDMRFGTTFSYGPYTGVINYTVNMLNSGSQYYFMVRGGNGCATGNWSNSMGATTTASGSATVRSFYGGGGSGYAGAGGGGTSGGGGGAITAGVSADGTHPIFARDLYPGMRGADVRSLQMYLNQKGFILAQSGPGSPGNETDYYGPLTANAVRRFQEAHYAEILSPLGYSSGTGIFGPSTRAYVNAH